MQEKERDRLGDLQIATQNDHSEQTSGSEVENLRAGNTNRDSVQTYRGKPDGCELH